MWLLLSYLMLRSLSRRILAILVLIIPIAAKAAAASRAPPTSLPSRSSSKNRSIKMIPISNIDEGMNDGHQQERENCTHKKQYGETVRSGPFICLVPLWCFMLSLLAPILILILLYSMSCTAPSADAAHHIAYISADCHAPKGDKPPLYLNKHIAKWAPTLSFELMWCLGTSAAYTHEGNHELVALRVQHILSTQHALRSHAPEYALT